MSILDKIAAPVLPDLNAPTIDNAALSGGVLARFQGSREVTADARACMLHTFTSAGIDGRPARWAVWGTAALDAIADKLRAGALAYVRYCGKIESAGSSRHVWDVRVIAGASSGDVSELRAETAAGEDRVARAAAAAEHADEARRAELRAEHAEREAAELTACAPNGPPPF